MRIAILLSVAFAFAGCASSQTSVAFGQGPGTIRAAFGDARGVVLAGREVATSQTSRTGRVAFRGLEPGDYVLAPIPQDAQRTRSLRRPFQRRRLRLASLGDAFMTYGGGAIDGASERFAAAGVQLVHDDHSEANALSRDWRPQGSSFRRAMDRLDRPDVIVLGVGGYDLVEWFQEHQSSLDIANIGAELQLAYDVVARAIRRVRRSLRLLRARFPNALLVAVVYPNMLESVTADGFIEYGRRVLAGYLDEILRSVRDEFEREDVLVLDLHDAMTGEADFADSPVQLNDHGEALAGARLFELLGGVRLEGEASWRAP